MKPTILEKIYTQKKVRVEAAKMGFEYGSFVQRAKTFRRNEKPHRFQAAFENEAGIGIIAEIKRASPSKGMINEHLDAGRVACEYEDNGAAAISVLTEQDFFKGDIEDLMTARNLTDLPILRKDFVFDEFQVYESALIGADAILLIVSMLSDEEIRPLYSLACELGLDVLVETHNLGELVRATELGAKIIGINNRNLNTFEVSLDVSRDLVRHAPDDVMLVTESGISTRGELKELETLGFRAALIGESLMRANETGAALKAFR